MKAFFFSCMLLLLLFGCNDSNEQRDPDTKGDTLFQYSTLATLLQGVYDGNMSVEELKENGDFGLGTFNALDGEMIVFEGNIYQVASDGIARVMDDDVKVPFAALTYFEVDQTITIDSPMDCAELQNYIDKKLPSKNIAYAIQISATFTYVKTRSVPSQSEPYAVLSEVIKTQPTFEFFTQKGTMIGFRLPSYMAPANASGYHLHFLTQEKNAGGHLLECQVGDAKVELDYTDTWKVVLPSDSKFYDANLTDERYE